MTLRRNVNVEMIHYALYVSAIQYTQIRLEDLHWHLDAEAAAAVEIVLARAQRLGIEKSNLVYSSCMPLKQLQAVALRIIILSEDI